VVVWGILGATVSAGLALCSTKVLLAHFTASGLGDFLARSAPYTLCWCCCASPMFEPALLAQAGVSDIRASSCSRGLLVVFLFMMLIFSGWPLLSGNPRVGFLVLFLLRAIYWCSVSRCIRVAFTGGRLGFRIRCMLAVVCIPFSCHGPNFRHDNRTTT